MESKDKPYNFSQLQNAWQQGLKGSLTVAFPINMFNHISVAGCKTGLNMWNSSRLIYNGMTDNISRSFLNFGHGLKAHFFKEVPRSFFNSGIFYCLSPWLYQNYDQRTASLGVAIASAINEVIIAPFDTWRVNIQAAQKLEMSPNKLYAGSLLGGIRLFLTWHAYGETATLCNPLLQQQGIDPNSLMGIALKSPLQAATYTPFVYPLERLKNEIQYRSGMTHIAFGRRMLEACRLILKTQGIRGVYTGVCAKVIVNTFFAAQGSYLHSRGSAELAA